MPGKNTIPLTQSNSSANEELIDFKKVFSQILSRRYLFGGALAGALMLAFLYNTFTLPVSRVSATILINEDSKSNPTGNDQLLEGFGLMPGLKNLDNQIMVLTSRNLVLRTLDELQFELEFFDRRLFKSKSFYPATPVQIVLVSGRPLPEDVVFSIKNIGNNMFRIDARKDKSFKIHKKALFGSPVEINGSVITITKTTTEERNADGNRKLYFIYHSRRKLVEDYIERLKIGPVTKKGTIVKVMLDGTNKNQDLAFLNTLTYSFVNMSLEKKNSEAIRTIEFIDDQLSGISDSLILTESRLQKFRSRNRVMNLSSQGQVIIDQVMRLETEKARLGMEKKYFDYLAEYLEKDFADEVPVAPATMGISDQGLSKLVADLADLQGQLYSKGMGTKNPMQSQLLLKIKNIKEALKETLKGLIVANDLAVKNNSTQINALNARASALPGTERELLGIERKYKLNDELYTFLLEKRAVAQMQKASNTADNEIIDYPEYDNEPVSPKKALIYIFALMAGISFPFLWIFFANMFNVKISGIDEISSVTDIPVSGYIPHHKMKRNTILFDEPESPVAEAFRLLRSRLVYFIKDIRKPVILVTSSMPEEGKTTVAINLASAYSLLGKKTILVGFDLRQPGIYNDFSVENNHGVSTWLIGKDKLENVIIESKQSNLHFILSGPIPPNPAELTTLDRTDELIRLLKEKFEYIIIDTSPVGIISDTYHLISLADVCVLVVRQNHTIKELFADTLRDMKKSNAKSINLVVNDIIPNGRSYGYGSRYHHDYRSKSAPDAGKAVLYTPDAGKLRK